MPSRVRLNRGHHPPRIPKPRAPIPPCPPGPKPGDVNPVPPPPLSGYVSPLTRIPPDVAEHRQRIFALETPIQFMPQVWDRFWPYIDNVWRTQGKDGHPNLAGVRKVYGYCRLARCRNHAYESQRLAVEEGHNGENGAGGRCQARFKLSLFPNGVRMLERMGEVGHNHDLDFVDFIKRPTAIRNIVLDDFFKSWQPAGIFAFLKDMSQQPDGRDILREAGGLYLSRSEVENTIATALKKAYPGQDISEVKNLQDKYKSYMTCTVKGCVAPPFQDSKSLRQHRAEVHGFVWHDHRGKLPCSEKSCPRRKPSRGFTSLTALHEHQRRVHGLNIPMTPVPEGQTPVREDQAAEDAITASNLQALARAARTQPGTPVSDETSNGPGDDSRAEPVPASTEGTELQLPTGTFTLTVSLTTQQRQGMEHRLRQLESNRVNIENEIEYLRRMLYGNGSSTVSDSVT